MLSVYACLRASICVRVCVCVCLCLHGEVDRKKNIIIASIRMCNVIQNNVDPISECEYLNSLEFQ